MLNVKLKCAETNWEASYPRPQLKPDFYKDDSCIGISTSQDPHVFGYWKHMIKVEAQKAYKVRVLFKATGIDNLHLNLLNMLLWKKPGRKDSECPQDMVRKYRKEGEYIIGEDIFVTDPGVTEAEIQLGIRFTSNGHVQWYDVEVTEVPLPGIKKAIVSVIKFNSLAFNEQGKLFERISSLLDRAAENSSNIVLLPEFSNVHSGTDSEKAAEDIPGGVLCDILSNKAKEYKMTVCAGIIEKDENLIYNTAVIFDKNGSYSGKYRKVHPYWPEEYISGITPGNDHPVFNVDSVNIGIMICYDSWYSESARILGLKGADLILFPNAGYEPLLMPARAIDNGIYLAISSMNCEAAIYDTMGGKMAYTTDGIVSATIDLNKKPSPHNNAGGNLNSSPAGRRGSRNSMSDKLYEEIIYQIKEMG